MLSGIILYYCLITLNNAKSVKPDIKPKPNERFLESIFETMPLCKSISSSTETQADDWWLGVNLALILVLNSKAGHIACVFKTGECFVLVIELFGIMIEKVFGKWKFVDSEKLKEYMEEVRKNIFK